MVDGVKYVEEEEEYKEEEEEEEERNQAPTSTRKKKRRRIKLFRCHRTGKKETKMVDGAKYRIREWYRSVLHGYISQKWFLGYYKWSHC